MRLRVCDWIRSKKFLTLTVISLHYRTIEVELLARGALRGSFGVGLDDRRRVRWEGALCMIISLDVGVEEWGYKSMASSMTYPPRLLLIGPFHFCIDSLLCSS
jgi:hypothetical protein